MRKIKTSRILNNDSYFLGLSYNDISLIGVLLLCLILVGKVLKIESQFWALIVTVSFLFFLVPIRMKFRRKIIRDSIKYLFFKGVCSVSRNRRNNKA